MKSLEARFKKFSDKNPGWISYVCFACAVMEQKFNRNTLTRWFNKLVEKDDYMPERKSAFDHLWKLNNDAEAYHF